MPGKFWQHWRIDGPVTVSFMSKNCYLRFFWVLLLIPATLPASDFNKGMEHMQNGDYARAYCLWEPLARLGHPDAQYHMGWLYANGHGLNVDVGTAVYWWQQAANNGYLDAQFSIGLAYITPWLCNDVDLVQNEYSALCH